MLKRFSKILIVLALIVGTTVGLSWRVETAPRPDKVTGSGTKGNIARWVDTNEIGDSTITEDDGFFGVGTPINPNFKFLISSDLASPKATFRATNIADGRAIEGSSVNGIGINGLGFISGVNGLNPTTNPNGAGVRGVAPNGAWAGDFVGPLRVQGDAQFFQDLNVSGTLTKAAGSFKIDHPLDPKNKYLSHSFVESPDMMNIYNGNVVTNAQGEATVELPAYFDSLNRDFRYQLTVVGQFAQAMVMEKVNGNRFKIKTDKPNVEVSWQVTGIRKDKFAEEHRIKVESDKPESERGKLQNP